MQEQKSTQESIHILKQKIKCKGNNKCQWFCSEQKCKENSFICQKQQCVCQKQIHKKCRLFQKVNKVLQNIYNKLKVKNTFKQKYITQVQNIFNNIIDQISFKRQQLTSKIKYFQLNEAQRKIILKFEEQKFSQVTGQDLYRTYILHQQSQISLNQEIPSKQLQSLNKRYLQQFQIISKKMIKQFQILISGKLISFSQSLIIKDNSQKYFIRQSFNKKIKSCQLIFRASQNNFQADKFHEKCDGTENTFVLIQNQYGKKIAGYTPLSWGTKGSITDQKGQSFILSISQKEKYNVREKSGAILSQTCGPTFGNAFSDIYLPNNANIYQGNFNIGSSYGQKLEQNESINRIERFCGNKDFKAKVKQYEVYKINFFD